MPMNDGFVTVYSKKTSEKHRVPAHWVDHPVLGKDFQKTPKQKAAEAAPPAGSSRADYPSASTEAADKTPDAGEKE